MTLTELLVVMTIILILVSAVVVTVVRLSAQGPLKGTQGLLQKLAGGLDAYRATYRMYPPEDSVAAVPTNAQDSYLRSSWVVWYAVEYTGQGQFITAIPSAYKAPGGGFTDSNGSVQTWYYYQDAWRQPLRYVCKSPYNQYKLTSGGPDLTIPGTSDDAVDADDVVVP